MTRAIFFDMGNTIFDFHRGAIDEEKDIEGLKRMEAFLQNYNQNVTFKIIKSEFYPVMINELKKRSSLSKELPIESYLDPFLRAYNISLTKAEKIKLMMVMFSCFKETVWYEKTLPQTLSQLKQQGFKLAVLSNVPFFPEIFIDIFSSLDLKKYFDNFTFSYSTSAKKPHAEIFLEALKTIGAKAENSVMVGNKLNTDIIPAKLLGFKTVWIPSKFSVKGDFLLKKDNPIDFKIQSLSELPIILKEIF